jgi:hypothetical protein
MEIQEDWIKTVGWDFPDNWKDFCRTLMAGLPRSQMEEVIRELQALPMWKAAPQDVRLNAARFLSEGSDYAS